MVRITTLDSTEESSGIVERKDLEEDAVTDDSEESPGISKAKTAESFKVLSQATVSGIINTIGIGLFAVCAVVFWIWKKQMAKENILKYECSIADDGDDEKPNCPEETKEQRSCDKHDENLNIINSLAVHNHNARKENEYQSLPCESDLQSFSYCNLLPEQPKRATQVASKELSTKSDVNKKDVTKEPLSPSLQYLTELNKPKEMTDGAVASTCRLDDMFMFPQDSCYQYTSEPKNIAKLPSHINTNHKNTKQQLAMSKSLDSHRTSLEKGCKLLETKPFKSSLRRGRSEECLKKFVHFPEDIRNIRKVFKYDSLDDMIFLKTDKDEDETNE